MQALKAALLEPESHNRELGFTLGFAALLLACYYVFLCVRRAPLSLDERLARGEDLESRLRPDGSVLDMDLPPEAGFVHCRYCNSDDVARSRARGVVERLLRYLHLRPYRCLLCSRRFFGSMRLVLKVERKAYQWE